MYSQITANKRKTWLLVSLFSIFVLSLGWVFSTSLEYGYSAVVIAFLFAFLMTLTSYYAGDTIALKISGARPIRKEENPYVYRIVENLTITAGVPMPKIYVIEDRSANAFATGRDPSHASIALTTGIIDLLQNEELEGVIAHELSHIKNYDIRIMMIVIVLVGFVAMLSDIFLRMQWGGFGGRRNREGGRAQLILLLFGIILAILSPLIGKLIQLAVSRKREFLADASGVLLTRYPEGLISALLKIEKQGIPLVRANDATAHLFFANPFTNKLTWFHKLFLTHPPIEERVKALGKMA